MMKTHIGIKIERMVLPSLFETVFVTIWVFRSMQSVRNSVFRERSQTVTLLDSLRVLRCPSLSLGMPLRPDRFVLVKVCRPGLCSRASPVLSAVARDERNLSLIVWDVDRTLQEANNEREAPALLLSCTIGRMEQVSSGSTMDRRGIVANSG
jgi:hypothetical protein